MPYLCLMFCVGIHYPLCILVLLVIVVLLSICLNMHVSMVICCPLLVAMLFCSLWYNFNVTNISGLKFDAGKLVSNHCYVTILLDL